jgi:tetratricopeptide (TPR) repeat protein
LYPPKDSNDPLAIELAGYVAEYQRSGDLEQLLDKLRAFADRTDPVFLAAAARPFQGMPEVVIPLYERITRERPQDAQAMVILANAYWLAGRGPDAVSRLASQAKEIDPSNRGAWHLWALAESNVRKRVDRWLEVTRRFPGDQLARAALADNATSLATDEDDPVALKLAIDTYESLLGENPPTAQRLALEETLKALRHGQ